MSKLSDVEKRRIQRAQPGRSIPDWMLRPNAMQSLALNSQTTMQPNAATDLGVSVNLLRQSHRDPGVSLGGSLAAVDTITFTPGQNFATHTTDDIRRLYGALSGSLRPTSWLRLRGTTGGDYVARADRALLKPSDCLTTSCSKTGSDIETNGQNLVKSFDLGASITLPVFSWLQSQTSWGSQYNRQQYSATSVSASGLAYGNTSANGAQSVTTTQTTDDAAVPHRRASAGRRERIWP
jgi:hypothetical protein